MGKYYRCAIDACDNDMRNQELHKKHSNLGRQTSNSLIYYQIIQEILHKFVNHISA